MSTSSIQNMRPSVELRKKTASMLKAEKEKKKKETLSKLVDKARQARQNQNETNRSKTPSVAKEEEEEEESEDELVHLDDEGEIIEKENKIEPSRKKESPPTLPNESFWMEKLAKLEAELNGEKEIRITREKTKLTKKEEKEKKRMELESKVESLQDDYKNRLNKRDVLDNVIYTTKKSIIDGAVKF